VPLTVGAMQLEVIQWSLNIGNAGRRASVPSDDPSVRGCDVTFDSRGSFWLFFISVPLVVSHLTTVLASWLSLSLNRNIDYLY